jgi:hypothetical protein
VEASYEHEAVMTLFEDGEEKFTVPFGLCLHGNDSRFGAKKNYQLRFRAEYGVSKLNYHLFDSRDIELNSLEEDLLDNASYFGRIFARSGGLTDATAQAMKEQNIDFEIKPVVCDGIEACRVALLKLNKGVLDGNFIEGMACIGGCIGGAGCLTHGDKNKTEVDKYGREALEKNIRDSISLLK